ncbi:phage terminase small subunit P27 family [Roseovarius sp. Pro17]|uniref:phage terminase small subunit P27 family n=1 Tax=Roseovarius sp. Pro17 TaxID=3108175 RepID=UPI002D782746|nr:phage terminase small subunit P27 family [Roseovarius sp. Pro17]
MPKVVEGGTAAFAALPRCPPHLTAVARREWRRLASPLHSVGVLTVADRAALAVYCQAYSRWVEAEEKLATTPMLLKTPSGYVQQSPWLSVANKQMELMARYMGELGLTPVARARLDIAQDSPTDQVTTIEFVTVYTDKEGNRCERPLDLTRGVGSDGESDVKTISYK